MKLTGRCLDGRSGTVVNARISKTSREDKEQVREGGCQDVEA